MRHFLPVPLRAKNHVEFRVPGGLFSGHYAFPIHDQAPPAPLARLTSARRGVPVRNHATKGAGAADSHEKPGRVARRAQGRVDDGWYSATIGTGDAVCCHVGLRRPFLRVVRT
jgi:hypothetical protein